MADDPGITLIIPEHSRADAHLIRKILDDNPNVKIITPGREDARRMPDFPANQDELRPPICSDDAATLRRMLGDRTPCWQSLFWASACGSSSCAQILIDAGVPIDTPMEGGEFDGSSALNMALLSMRGSFSMPWQPESDKSTRPGARKCAELILERRRSSPEGINGKHCDDLFHECVLVNPSRPLRRHEESTEASVKLLLDARMDPNTATTHPLHTQNMAPPLLLPLVQCSSAP